jgi:hypothetical protein
MSFARVVGDVVMVMVVNDVREVAEDGFVTRRVVGAALEGMDVARSVVEEDVQEGEEHVAGREVGDTAVV